MSEEITEVLVCMPASEPANFADDEYGECCKCGVRVRFRPHASKIARRICVACARPMVIEDLRQGRFRAAVSEQALRELALYLAKPRGRA